MDRASSLPSLRVFAICLVAWILSNMDQSFFGYAVPEIMREFDVGLLTIGNILSLAFIAASISVVGVGLLADRYGRRVMFAACLSISALLVGMQAFVTSIEMLAVLRCLAFAVATGLVPVTNALVVEVAPTRYRGLWTGILQCGYPIGWAVSSAVAMPLMNHGGWRYMFLPALAVVPIALLLAWALPESARFKQTVQSVPEAQTTTAWSRVSMLFGPAYRRRTILCWLAFFFFGGAYAGTAFYFPTFFQEVRGYSTEESMQIVGLSYGIGFIGYIAAAAVGEFVTTRRNTIVIWMWIGTLGVFGVVTNDGGFTANVLWFGITAMFFYGSAAVLTTFAAEIFPTRVRATGVAVAAGVGINLGFALFPPLVAALVGEVGWKMAFLIGVIPPLFLAGFVTLWQPNIRSGQELES